VIVDNQRRVTTINVNDRRRVHGRRIPGMQWEDFAGLSREEKREAEEAARDLVLRASRPPMGAWLRRLSWLATPLMVTWSWTTFGAAGVGLTVAWRGARYLELFSYVQTGFETMMDAVELVQSAGEALEHVEDAWESGALELPLICLGLVGLLIWGLLHLRTRWAAWTAPPSPEPSESGSEAGHSLPPSDDEKTDDQAMKGLIETLQSKITKLEKAQTRAAAPADGGGSRPKPGQPPPKKGQHPPRDDGSRKAAGRDGDAGPDTGSDSSGSAGALPLRPPRPDELEPAVDQIMKRLVEHEAAVMQDRAVGRATTRAECVGSAAATAGSDPATSRLRQALRDPRAKVLEQLESASSSQVDWVLPANVEERVAAPLLVQIFSVHPSATAMANRWVQEKELQRNHVAHEMLLMCMVLDKSLMGPADFVTSEGCEIMCRRIYALKKAFENVKTANDWRQPKGAGAAKWKSKVRWDLANEIDIRALAGDVESLPGIDKELQGRLKERALLNKYVDQVTAGGAADEQ
jgi:hypothetical protein